MGYVIYRNQNFLIVRLVTLAPFNPKKSHLIQYIYKQKTINYFNRVVRGKSFKCMVSTKGLLQRDHGMWTISNNRFGMLWKILFNKPKTSYVN